ncbi:sialidase [Hahella sp. CCB-MM4]|uniref:sialidase n=1 Tax=Hahella sp. (strain CCB-MM4) TaxID=1926491 RepID=UPI000B9BFCB1|nr:sialidase [Hahella sp. CCB-MM4]OZG70199.1 sialidase [Hahella sp. CCB-MM4]
MTLKLQVGTRKGLFIYERNAAGQWTASDPEFLGDPVTMLLHDHRNGYQYVALNLGHFGVKMHRRSGGSSHWEEIEPPRFPVQDSPSVSAESTEAGESVKDAPSVEQIWELVTGGSDEPGVLWAGTIPGGLFKSADNGSSWQLIEPLWQRPEREFWFGGGYDHPGIHSISVHPDNSRHLSLAISCGGVWQSLDGGGTWELVGKGLRAAYMPPEQAFEQRSQDPHRMVRCPSAPDHLWIQHHNGIFRSIDGGLNWNEIKDVFPSVFGFAVAVHPLNPDIAWFVPGVKDETRVPVDGRLVVTRTRDGGKTFETLCNGLPQEKAYDLTYRHALDVDSDGKVLAFGSTTGNLWVSEDQGDHWQCLSHHLPPINVVRFSR